MKNWRELVVRPEAAIRETIGRIDAAGLQIALVADANDRLIGTVTDGDVRRGILRGVSLDDPVSTIMNRKPVKARPEDDRETVLTLLRTMRLRQIAIVDASDCLVGIEVLDDLLESKHRPNPVVLMAGGLGTRLRPLTEDCPKPMLKVGGRPILETILLSFLNVGFSRFYFAVNYRAEMIREYFGNGSRWGAHIDYLEEDRKLGTAGALSLLPEASTLPLFVMNGDLLTKVNFDQMLDFHTVHGSAATMGVREYDFQVPYGVVRLRNHKILEVAEKPVQRFFVNAGIYVLNPEAVAMIPRGEPYDMPTLFADLMRRGKECGAFPIREYWLDIGHHADLERANGEFDESIDA